MKQITVDESEELQSQGVATLFDCPCPETCGCGFCGFGGFFETEEEADQSIVLVINNQGYFIRAREDLVKSNDGVFVGFVENGKPPEFDEVFRIERL